MKIWSGIDQADQALKALENSLAGLGFIPKPLAREVWNNLHQGYAGVVEYFLSQVDPLILSQVRKIMSEDESQ